MELTFLGRGSAFNPGEGNTSAYLREDGRVLLLDCGETVFGRLIDRGVLADAREVYAVVSHLHSDHCGSLSTLALYCFWRMRQQLTLVTAEDPEYVGQLRRLLGLSGHTWGGRGGTSSCVSSSCSPCPSLTPTCSSCSLCHFSEGSKGTLSSLSLNHSV